MTNGKKDRLEHSEEILHMAALQTAENTKQIAAAAKQIVDMGREFDREMTQVRAEHNREMKEIKNLFKEMLKRIVV